MEKGAKKEKRRELLSPPPTTDFPRLALQAGARVPAVEPRSASALSRRRGSCPRLRGPGPVALGGALVEIELRFTPRPGKFASRALSLPSLLFPCNVKCKVPLPSLSLPYPVNIILDFPPPQVIAMSSNNSFPSPRNLPLNLNLESANSFLTAYRVFLFAHCWRAFFFFHRDTGWSERVGCGRSRGDCGGRRAGRGRGGSRRGERG